MNITRKNMEKMMAISKYFYSKSNLFACVLLTAVMIFYASLVMGSQSKCIQAGMQGDASLPGLRFGYSYTMVVSFFDSMTREGLICYSRLLRIWDNIFPFIYGAMYISWISFIFKKQAFNSRFIALVNIFPLNQEDVSRRAQRS